MRALENPIEKIMISEEEIRNKVQEIAKEIDSDYKDREPMLLAILNGSFVFAADLVRAVSIPVGISFIFASSYGASTVSSGKVDIHSVKGFDPAGKDIIIVEDIIDSGRTLSKIKEYLYENGANSVELCTFLNKPSRRVVELDVKYIGFEVPDEFVVGYGLDFDSKYRQYPFVGVLKQEYYE